VVTRGATAALRFETRGFRTGAKLRISLDHGLVCLLLVRRA